MSFFIFLSFFEVVLSKPSVIGKLRINILRLAVVYGANLIFIKRVNVFYKGRRGSLAAKARLLAIRLP